MNVAFDREERRKQKEILRQVFPDYDPKYHDAFVDKYNKQEDKKSGEQYRKNRGFENGVSHALTEIQNKAASVGVRLVNEIDPKAALDTMTYTSDRTWEGTVYTISDARHPDYNGKKILVRLVSGKNIFSWVK